MGPEKLILIFVILFCIIFYFIFCPKIPQTDWLDFSYSYLIFNKKALTIDGLEEFIDFTESRERYLDINTRKKLIFFNEKKKTEYVILFFHGFHSTNREGEAVVKRLGTLFKANCYLTRFPGHGVFNKETSHINLNLYHYLREVYDSFLIAELLGKKIILVGSSTGCTYAIWAIFKFLKQFNIYSTIFFSPNLELTGIVRILSRILTWPLGYYFLIFFREKLLVNHYIIDSNIALQLIGILTIVRNLKKNKFEIPILIFSSEKDNIVSYKAAIDFFKKVSSKQKTFYTLKQTNHQIINDKIYEDKFINYIKDFHEEMDVNNKFEHYYICSS